MSDNVSTKHWKQNEEIQYAKKCSENVSVIHESDDRWIKLIQEFNCFITKNEEEKQCLLQAILEHQKKFLDGGGGGEISSINFNKSLLRLQGDICGSHGDEYEDSITLMTEAIGSSQTSVIVYTVQHPRWNSLQNQMPQI
jgi:hypothetical protein